MSVPAFLHPFAPPAQERFVRIERGEGAVVWDDAGKAYVDGMASLWYCNVGHGRREVADAIGAQAAKLSGYQCFAPFTNGPADALAERIVALAPMAGARVFYTSSGSEAVDSAIKLARIAHERAGEPGRDLVISRTNGYHGVTYGGMSAQGIAPNREGFGPLVPGFLHVDHHDLDALEAALVENPGRVAAVIVEPLQGAGGVFPPREGYLQRVRELCTRHGAFLVADEVVTGFGRLGTWFGSQHYGVEPDLLTFAKAVTSGYVPLGGVIVGPAVRAPLEADKGWMLRHGHTYSGHPLACAAGLAVLDLTEREGLLGRVPHLQARFAQALGAFAAQGRVAEARGAGGVWALKMLPGVDAFAVRDAAMAEGVIVRAIGDALAMCPPLVITDAQLDTLFGVLDQVLPHA